METKLIRNTQLTGGTANSTASGTASHGPITLPNNPLDKTSYHIQAAMQEMRDDPPGDFEFEQHCARIYHLLYEAMNLLVTGPPRPPSCLQSDLDDVMGGSADGTTPLPQVQNDSTSTE